MIPRVWRASGARLRRVPSTHSCRAKVMGLPDPTGRMSELDALGDEPRATSPSGSSSSCRSCRRPARLVDSVTDPGQLADPITSQPDIPVEEKQDVLETDPSRCADAQG